MRVSHHLLVLFFLAGLCSLVDSYIWRPIPGALQNISKNDKGVKKAVLVGTYSFNNKSNDAFLFRASAVDDAKRQIVKGIRYVLTVEISRTMCRKMGNNDDLPNCPFQTDSLLKQGTHVSLLSTGARSTVQQERDGMMIYRRFSVTLKYGPFRG